jgi:tetratricopeptide (TPR) repeat protein
MEEEEKENFSAALHNYELALEANPMNKKAHKRMGLLLSENPVSWGSAIWHLEKALSLDPSDDKLREILFYLYLSAGKESDAEGMIADWKVSGKESLAQDMSLLFECEFKNRLSKANLEILNRSEKISEFWKLRCNKILSNN